MLLSTNHNQFHFMKAIYVLFRCLLKSIAMANNYFDCRFDTDLKKKLRNVFYFHSWAPQV